ncbi:hypothetical protein [Cerasicoccus fimbriatus]|uniref:hypothetical protein n=1 Tax=Cerasicoccus fimbriatus TaxID=3014554 RepID=UPI0022B36627|nr:hypothetical protein [Cerasicoccus sp. TK19100]
MRLYPHFLLTISVACSAQAAFTPLGTQGDDPNNYGTFTSSVLDSVTLNGKTYSTSELTQIELTAFAGASSSVLLQNDGGPSNPTEQQRRDFLETDWRGDTGIINPTITNDSVAAIFKSPVVNIDGPDMFFYEINSSGADGFEIRINGVQLTVNSSDYGDSGANTFNDDVLSLSSTPGNLTQLLTLSATLGSPTITQNIMGVGIDFSDFGVALGESVTSFTFNSSSSGSTVDPVIIAAVPEPQTYAMLAGLACLTLAIYRRRSR